MLDQSLTFLFNLPLQLSPFSSVFSLFDLIGPQGRILLIEIVQFEIHFHIPLVLPEDVFFQTDQSIALEGRGDHGGAVVGLPALQGEGAHLMLSDVFKETFGAGVLLVGFGVRVHLHVLVGLGPAVGSKRVGMVLSLA